MSASTLEDKLENIKCPGLQSQEKTVVVLRAVEATLKEQNTTQTATAYFAALLSSLNQVNSNGSVNTGLSAPIVYLLDVVIPFAPVALLRSKFTQILTLLAPILLLQDAEAPLLRSSIGCLETLLIAQDSIAWDLSVTQIGPRRAVAGLLNLALDHRPKVRKRALDALRKILQNPPPSPSSDHPAADMCAHAALASLGEMAAKAQQQKQQQKQKKNKKKGSDDSGAHDPGLLHALHMVKTVASASSGWPGPKIEPLCELLLGIARVGNEYMVVSTFDIFEKIFEGLAGEVASAKLPRLMAIIMDLRPSIEDAQLIPPWLAVLSRGYDVCAELEPEDTFAKLPDVIEMVVPFLRSPAPEVRASGAECLRSLVATCIPSQVVLEPSIYDEKVLAKVAQAATSLLSVQYQAAWLDTFHLIGTMFDALRWRAFPTMTNVVGIIGDIRSNSSFRNKEEADAVLGKAVRAMGPEAVLAVLPLNLSKPAKGQSGRAWMLPILRDYTSNTTLAHFRAEMVPLSKDMFQKVLDHGDAAKTMEIKIYETVVQQAWSTLPGYCDLPLDLATAFDEDFAQQLAELLYGQVQLRLDICRGLKNLVESSKDIAELGGREEDDLLLQSRTTKEQAKANLAHLGQYSANMLAVLFNVYTQTLPQNRGPMLQTINAFLSITPQRALLDTFDKVSKLLADELQKPPTPPTKQKGKAAQDHLPPTSNTLMDLIITMSVHLPRESFGAVFEIAAAVINKEEEPQLQKKAYKLIPRLAESEVGRVALEERFWELQELLTASAQTVSAPARRERLAAIEALLPFVPDAALHFIPTVISEVVICCKENNERARESAYNLLVRMGQRMEAAQGAMIRNSKVPHMPKDAADAVASIEEYFTIVSAGLAGSTPHMISATVTAITRLMYEFRSALSEQTLTDLVQTMDLFLTSNNREIVKSVLGFVKVSVISLPSDLMIPRLASLIPNLIIWSNEHKAHFKSKVKHIMERMLRKYGFDLLNKNCPEAERKLITNIRRTKERARKKKETGEEGGEEAEEEKEKEEEDEEEEEEGKPSRKFDSEYDEALYSSESESEHEDGQKAAPRKSKKRGPKGGDAYIVEDEDEPLDLLDRRSLANISSTRPARVRKPTRSEAKYDADGKLILGKDGDDEGGMDVDKPEGEESGIGAYVAALKSRDAPTRGRGGKLKFSNRRAKGGENDDEMDEGDAAQASAQLRAARGGGRGGSRGGMRGRRGQGSRGGWGGRRDRSGKGGIAAGRRGLGEEKQRGLVAGGGVRKASFGGGKRGWR